jgi:hypothetical protein
MWLALGICFAFAILNVGVTYMLEKHIERKFCYWIKLQDHLCLKLRVDGQDGFPDRTVITTNERVFFVEFKRTEKDKLRPQQRKWKQLLESLGFTVLVTHSLEEAKGAFTRWHSESM